MGLLRRRPQMSGHKHDDIDAGLEGTCEACGQQGRLLARQTSDGRVLVNTLACFNFRACIARIDARRAAEAAAPGA